MATLGTSSLLALAVGIATRTALGQTTSNFPDCTSGPLANNSVCNPSLDVSTRAKGLVSLLTTAEKINATISSFSGVERLGLPAYEWWSEGLHGVANSPGVDFDADNQSEFGYATSFPQPITLGATFDDNLVFDVASIISTEARAFSNAGRAGLDFWTPVRWHTHPTSHTLSCHFLSSHADLRGGGGEHKQNINPFRDPRWGRGQETPGEDPFHLSSYVKALIAGLQGTDDTEGNVDGKYKKVVSTCKHFAGYDVESWNGNYRYQFDASITQQDMVEYYLPSFQACARDAKVGAFMCSYNAVNGVPTCADDWLLNDVLRDHWNWSAPDEGYWVTSDCDAIQNVFLPHRWADTREAAAAAALKAGTDLNCGTYYTHHLGGAYEQGLINDTDLDTAVTRLYGSLVRLGYFDPADAQPYRALGWANVSTPAAQDLAYQAAVKGTVLLKNSNNTLPLTDLAGKKVALIGDWAAATTQMQGNYYGNAPYLHSPLWAAQQLLGDDNVLYANGPSYGDPTTNSLWDPIWAAAGEADVILYLGGVDDSVESEGMDRVSLGWTGNVLDIIGELALLGKPLVVVQMGGGQVDSGPLVANPGVGALLWGGYPGQDGGVAILDVITGKQAPAGRLPLTQYPADYIQNVSMTDMSLRPSGDEEGAGVRFPGRTYRWYEGEATFPFGSGLHYTTFTAEVVNSNSSASGDLSNGATFDIGSLTGNCTGVEYLDLCPFAALPLAITNTGAITSDYVALLFLKGEFGPEPYPLKTLVAYARAQNVSAAAAAAAATVTLDLTLGSLSRVDEDGNRVLYPGSYSLVLDLDERVTVNFTLTGEQAVLDEWPAAPAPADRVGAGTSEVGADYFVGGLGSVAQDVLG